MLLQQLNSTGPLRLSKQQLVSHQHSRRQLDLVLQAIIMRIHIRALRKLQRLENLCAATVLVRFPGRVLLTGEKRLSARQLLLKM